MATLVTMLTKCTLFKQCGVHIAFNPYAPGSEFYQYKMMQKKTENDRNPGKWVLMWKHSARAFQ